MIGHYLMFNGDCAEALKTYEKAFGARTTDVMKYGDLPGYSAEKSEEERALVLNASIEIDGTQIMCADASDRAAAGENMYLTLTTADEAYARGAWSVLSEGAEIYMGLQETFFAAAHGSLRDKYGVNWMFTVTK